MTSSAEGDQGVGDERQLERMLLAHCVLRVCLSQLNSSFLEQLEHVFLPFLMLEVVAVSSGAFHCKEALNEEPEDCCSIELKSLPAPQSADIETGRPRCVS